MLDIYRGDAVYRSLVSDDQYRIGTELDRRRWWAVKGTKEKMNAVYFPVHDKLLYTFSVGQQTSHTKYVPGISHIWPLSSAVSTGEFEEVI